MSLLYGRAELDCEFGKMRKMGLPTMFINSYQDMEEDTVSHFEVHFLRPYLGVRLIHQCDL